MNAMLDRNDETINVAGDVGRNKSRRGWVMDDDSDVTNDRWEGFSCGRILYRYPLRPILFK